MVAASFKALSQHLPETADENLRQNSSEMILGRPEILGRECCRYTNLFGMNAVECARKHLID
jgi:hypothetical protein